MPVSDYGVLAKATWDEVSELQEPPQQLVVMGLNAAATLKTETETRTNNRLLMSS